MTAKASSPAELAALAEALARENARLRGDLLTMSRRVSHDLRTPLSGISLACVVLAETPAGREPSPPGLSRSITDSIEEITVLIERVSFIAKASAQPLAPYRVAMGEVVWSALQRLERRIAKKGGRVTQPDSWPAVAGVAPWLEVVWENLVANALRHGGEAPQIDLGWARDEAGCRFWVEDRGPGVAEKQVSLLFEPFDQLHRVNAPRGLGLAVVQRLISLQGGRCGYAPRSGGGAHFFFTLPEADAALPQPSAPSR